MVAFNSLVEMSEVWMIFGSFRGVVSQDQMVLQRTLERFTHHVFKCYDLILIAQTLLYLLCLLVATQQVF